MQYSFEEAYRVPDDPDTNVSAHRNAIPFFGVGLLAAIDDEVILANADPDEENDDGISGRPNYAEGFVGRFGRKSQTVSIEGFIRGPLFNHMGITTNPLSNDRRNELPVKSGTDEEIEADAGVSQRNGVALVLEDIGCSSCHVPTLQTADGRKRYTRLPRRNT